jgi:hypothetical protein
MTVDDAITVLCVHTGGDLSSTQRLADAGPTIQPRSVRDTEAALDELERGAYDCLVLGETVRSDCVDALERITGAHPDVPVLCYGDSEEVGQYLDAGATDIVPADAGPHRSRLLVTVTADEDTVSVRVADDGPGIPEDELVGIFSEGEQTQLTHGTGFGLWLVRMVVDDYGGDLSYESPPDGGSVVVVTLGHEPDHGAVPERTDTAEHL